MRAILKSTGERGSAWQHTEMGQWYFIGAQYQPATCYGVRVERNEIVLIPEVTR